MIQGGDIKIEGSLESDNNKTKLKDENLIIKHSERGILAIADTEQTNWS